MIKFYQILVLLLFSISGFAQVYKVDTLVNNGPKENRINIVVLGDGFTADEMPKFRQEAQKFADFFRSFEPFSHYQKYFNFYAIGTPSAESGINNPGTAPDAYTDQPKLKVNNFYGSTFGTSIHRLVVIKNYSLMYQVLANNFPDYDMVVMIGNSTFYGGSGGSIAIFTLNSSSNYIGVHELGHSFSGLSDEYWAGTQYARENYNMTKETKPILVRWNSWIGNPKIGVFPHGTGEVEKIWFKPTNRSCLMELLSQKFCDVCKETTVEKVLELINPIEGIYPSPDSVVQVKDKLGFSLKLLHPEPNSLYVYWRLNGELIQDSTDSITLASEDIKTEVSKLTAEIIDETIFSRINPAGRKRIVSWTIVKTEEVTLKLSSLQDKICLNEVTKLYTSGCPGKLVWSTNQTTDTIKVSPSETKIYFAKCTLGSGKELKDSIKIELLPTTNVSASNSGPYLEGETIKLSASNGGTNYTWTGPKNFSASIQNPEILLSKNLNSGSYRVTLTNASGCKSSASTEVTVNIPLANEPETENWLIAYPNPAEKQVNIEIPYSGKSEVFLYSTEGKLLDKKTFVKSTLLDVEKLAAGVYILKVTNGEKVGSTKLVIK